MHIIIAGARRCGTTSLYNLLGAHPDIAMVKGDSPGQEVHYFDYGWHDMTEGEYWGLWGTDHELATLDKSPTYLYHGDAPGRAFRVCPNAKVIISLRSPVDRAYSDFWKRRAEKREPLDDFAMAVLRENRNWEQWHSEPHSWGSNRHYFGYIERSFYDEQVARWMRYGFDIYVIEYEKFWRSPTAGVYNLAEWLGVDPIKITAKPKGKKWKHVDYPPINWIVRDDLERVFEARTKALESLLGKKFSWGSKDECD